MSHVSRCEFSECERKSNCVRYNNPTGSVVNFKFLCYDREYAWYMPINGEPVEVVEEVNSKESIPQEVNIESKENINKDENVVDNESEV